MQRKQIKCLELKVYYSIMIKVVNLGMTAFNLALHIYITTFMQRSHLEFKKT